ncbi:hypothetical protein AVEN_248584-1 [Araneus ventricosus]|uniref:Uncharacterized protein n=1 Tax=Araneus ventricosus TaxID=182803 RepID=A0A4Y2I1S6_ARAVE|nr:hypothetical protein AVEN_248584-1 [Araneus ventricosus]
MPLLDKAGATQATETTKKNSKDHRHKESPQLKQSCTLNTPRLSHVNQNAETGTGIKENVKKDTIFMGWQKDSEATEVLYNKKYGNISSTSTHEKVLFPIVSMLLSCDKSCKNRI